MIIYCLFEQSGTFKNEFKKMGYKAYDYDILNDFNETDFQIDLYKEIEVAYSRERESIFDKMTKEDILLAFFPCVRFERQSLLNARCDNRGMKNWSLEKKLNYSIGYHREIAENFELITKLAYVCLVRGLRLIIENPYQTNHYLVQYWCIKPKLIIYDRRELGDFYSKPTMFYFINYEPQNNFVFEPRVVHKRRYVAHENKVNRSLISKDFANRFIREFILTKEQYDNLSNSSSN